MLKVTGPEATMTCKDDHICAILKLGIDGTVLGVQSIWDGKLTMEDWEFLLVYVKNVFNKINQIGILWKVQHLWSSGVRFVFYCYHHW